MVIEGVMQVGVSGFVLAIAGPGLSAEEAMAATFGDATKLLDVDVNKFASLGFFVAVRLGLADREPSGLIEMSEKRHTVAREDGSDRGAGYL